MASLGAKPAEGATKATSDGKELGCFKKLTPHGSSEGSATVAPQAEVTASKYVNKEKNHPLDYQSFKNIPIVYLSFRKEHLTF